MLSDTIFQNELTQTLETIEIKELGKPVNGKVRDCYDIKDKRILICSDRLSAFDKILTTIPFKGQLLTELSFHWFTLTEDIVPNHVIAHPHPNVIIAKKLKMIPIEVVVRGYLTGSAWRDYQKGNPISGVVLPAGLKKYQKFPEPLITPSTKAENAEHDLPISESEILQNKIVDEKIWGEIREKALAVFAFASEEAQKRGLLLVDTKFEFGLDKDGVVTLADEILTPDCSRYWNAVNYEERLKNNQEPENYDKELIRSWLVAKGFMGEGAVPPIPDELRIELAKKYVNIYEKLTASSFVPESLILESILESNPKIEDMIESEGDDKEYLSNGKINLENLSLSTNKKSQLRSYVLGWLEDNKS